MTENRDAVMERQDLQKAMGIKGPLGKLVARIVYRILELEKVNTSNNNCRDYYGPEFSEAILRDIGISYHIPEEQLARIPAEGGFVTISNHHFGAADGMILSSVVGSRRPDYKILTTFLLTLLTHLKDSFIGVDNFSSGKAQSISGIRNALAHIADGHPIGLFPAGEVATWQPRKLRTSVSGKHVVEDIPWADNMIKLVKKSGFPIIPIYFDGQNSRSFHILGKIHPRLRTIRLVHELFKMRGTCVQVRIGAPISAAEIEGMDIPTLGKYLRNRTYALAAQCRESEAKESNVFTTPIAPAVNPELVQKEIESLPQRVLFEAGDYRVYLLRSQEAPNTMKELWRLREETFRAVGEGTGHAEDTDLYDSYYRQMILWHHVNKEIVGAYRLGFGPEIMASHGGVSGFYTSTLFKYGPKAQELLSCSVELGRSFIVRKYQREVSPLKLLLAGIGVSTLEYPNLKYLSGPVSMSNEIPLFYKSLAYRYITRNYSLADAGQVAQPTHPFVPDYLSVNPDQLLQFPSDNMDYLDRLISTLSDGKYRLPVLFRKYFSCGAKLPCFNVDPDFANSFDGLIFLRLADFPEITLKSLLRGLPQDIQNKIWMRYFGTTLC